MQPHDAVVGGEGRILLQFVHAEDGAAAEILLFSFEMCICLLFFTYLIRIPIRMVIFFIQFRGRGSLSCSSVFLELLMLLRRFGCSEHIVHHRHLQVSRSQHLAILLLLGLIL